MTKVVTQNIMFHVKEIAETQNLKDIVRDAVLHTYLNACISTHCKSLYLKSKWMHHFRALDIDFRHKNRFLLEFNEF